MTRNSTLFAENSDNRSLKSRFMFLRQPGQAFKGQLPDCLYSFLGRPLEPRPIYRLFSALYPRWLVRVLGDRFGLNLMIEARKPQQESTP